jgi:hypothetical protein
MILISIMRVVGFAPHPSILSSETVSDFTPWVVAIWPFLRPSCLPSLILPK